MNNNHPLPHFTGRPWAAAPAACAWDRLQAVLLGTAVLFASFFLSISQARAYTTTTDSNGRTIYAQSSKEENIVIEKIDIQKPMTVRAATPLPKGNVTLTVKNSSITNAADNTAMVNVSDSGTATVTLSDVSIAAGGGKTGAAVSVAADGLARMDTSGIFNATVNARGLNAKGATVSINHSGTGLISAIGRAISADATNGDAAVTTAAGTKLTVAGADNPVGIYARAVNGSVIINSQSTVTAGSPGATGRGIFAVANSPHASSRIVINHASGAINVSGNNSSSNGGGIVAAMTGGDTGGVSINVSNAQINTEGSYSHGIYVPARFTSGDINIVADNAHIDVKGENSDGIYVAVRQENSSSNTNIVTRGGSITTTDPGNLPQFGETGQGIVVVHEKDYASGNATITNLGTAITTNQGPEGTGAGSRAMAIIIEKDTSSGNAAIFNTGALTTDGRSSYGILIRNKGTGSNAIENWGLITTSGNDASGLAITESTGTNAILNTAELRTSGDGAHGIVIHNTGTGANTIVNEAAVTTGGRDAHAVAIESAYGKSDILNTAALQTSGDGSSGISVKHYGDETTTIENHGQITTRGQDAHAIAVRESTGTNAILSAAELSTAGDKAVGILVKNSGEGTSDIQSLEKITTRGKGAHAISLEAGMGKNTIWNAGTLTATGENASGIHASTTTGDSTIVVDADIMAGWGTGTGITVKGKGGAHSVTNNAQVEAMSDHALKGLSAGGSTIDVVNNGTLTGYAAFGDEDTSFVNNNALLLRNFADTNGDGERDTRGVAVSDFGAGHDTFVNASNAVIRLLPVDGEYTVDAAGQYTPAGALGMQVQGIAHAYMLNLERFEHGGLIDMTANARPGDVMGITGGSVLGGNGGGTYVTNGGYLKLDTLLNQGGNDSLSDVLVVDNVVVGSGPTTLILDVDPNSPGGLTTGNGIKLVEVHGSQTGQAFVMDGPLVYGLYEYMLGNGLDGSNSWYLRNSYRPAVAGELANQHLASGMFTQNILDRRDNVRVPDTTIWMRLNHYRDKGTILTDIKSQMYSTKLQVGADLYRNEDYNIIAGLYGGLGKGGHQTTSDATGTRVKGEVAGYHVGAYATWLPQNWAKGFFLDLWGHYGWYNNKLSGQDMKYEDVTYASRGYALSAEIGYGIPLHKQENGNQWLFEPHAQAIYTRLTVDDFTDPHNTIYEDGNTTGFNTRLGGRLYMERPRENRGLSGLSPFIEGNWLYNGARPEVTLAGHTTLESKYGKSVGEIKAGVEGQPFDSLTLWGHVGYQSGTHNFERLEVQVGFGWLW